MAYTFLFLVDVVRQWNCTCVLYSPVSSSLHIDCIGRNLVAIPDNLPEKTTHLDLSNNKIEEIIQFPSLPMLHTLDMAVNKIKIIRQSAFLNAPNITRLYIQDNPIDMKTLPSGLFASIPRLTHLDISGHVAATVLWENNILGLIGTSYRDELYEDLTNLESLTIDGLPYLNYFFGSVNGTFGNGFRKLKALKHLRIKGYFPEIKSLTLLAFSGLPVKTLEIWSCWLTHIDQDAFSHMKHLEILDLSYNPTLGLDAVSHAWPGLSNLPIRQLILNRITEFSLRVQTLSESFFLGLEVTNITHLSLDGNHIIDVDPVLSHYLPQLVYLSLAYNRLEPLARIDDMMDDISKLAKLRHINFSEQFRRLYVSEWELLIGAYPNPLDAVNSGRRRRDTRTRAHTQTEMTRVRRSSPPINTDGLPLSYQQPINITLPPALEFADLSESLSISLQQSPTINIYQAGNLQTFIYRRNDIQRFENLMRFVGESPRNMTLDLSENDCTLFAMNAVFAELHREEGLHSLILEHNKLGEYIRTQGEAMFQGFKSIEVVDFSDNLIKDLPSQMFRDQSRLKLLDLSDNSLRSFQLETSHMGKLQNLNLSHNLLPSLSLSTMADMENIGLHQAEDIGLVLDLNGNSLICGCDYLDFMRWVQKHREQYNGLVIANVDFYTCFVDGVEQQWSRDNLPALIRSLEFKCSLTKYIIIGCVMFAVLAIIIGVSLCIQRHKWDIKFWIVNHVMKRKAIQQELVETRNITHDAFVAYHQDDIRWIKDELIKNTEQIDEHPLKLILHHRDFLLGTIIEENIVQSIRCSRRTLLLISSQFLVSNWCQFEVQMARAESFDIGRDVVIAVLLEPVSVLIRAPGMSTIVQNILKKRTYVEWPDNEEERVDFWKRLREAIRKSVGIEMTCECGRVMSDGGTGKSDTWAMSKV